MKPRSTSSCRTLASPGLVAAVLSTIATTGRATEPTKAECNDAHESRISLRTAGKLLDARAVLAVCASASCPGSLREACARRADDLNALIPGLVFAVKDAGGNDLSAVGITMDGVPAEGPLA